MSNFTNSMRDLLDSVAAKKDPKKQVENRRKKARRMIHGRLHANVVVDGKIVPFRRPK